MSCWLIFFKCLRVLLLRVINQMASHLAAARAVRYGLTQTSMLGKVVWQQVP